MVKFKQVLIAASAAIAFMAGSVQAMTTVGEVTGGGTFSFTNTATVKTATATGSMSGTLSVPANAPGRYGLGWSITLNGYGGNKSATGFVDMGIFTPSTLFTYLDSVDGLDVNSGSGFTSGGSTPSLNFNFTITEPLFTALISDIWGGTPPTTNASGTTGGFTSTLTLAAVPLPASLPLLLAGIGGFAALRRRKKKAA